MQGSLRHATSVVLAALLLATADPGRVLGNPPATTTEILLTSEAGHRVARLANVAFQPGVPTGVVIAVYPDQEKQTIHGIGTSFTESSAFVLAHLDPEQRHEVMRNIFGESGANFSLTRTHIGSCDFSVEGKYSYAPTDDDRELASFSIDEDLAGFDPARYPGIRDAGYDLLPMIQEAMAIKKAQGDEGPSIVASAWTAPPWMKDTGEWYIPGSPENDWQGDAGSLKPEYVTTYTEYLAKYLNAYRDAGVGIWGLTPVNEPHGNGGHWESMHFTPETQLSFVVDHLGPRLKESGHGETRILVFDQNRDGLEEWANAILPDPRAAEFVFGVAVHWYASTFKVFEDALDRVHARYPNYAIVHTEGCIDNLGNKAGGGIEDPEGFQESGWFGNDAFWWNATATDWAYTASWAGEAAADHPMYVPVHRYARNIIVSLDHWVGGWIDWNIVLDREGGPNHVGNFCGAPIMIDTETRDVYYTPIYHVLTQFSRTIRPGDRAVRTTTERDGLDADALQACATINDDGVVSVQILNTTREPIPLSLRISDGYASITIPANSVQTVRAQL